MDDLQWFGEPEKFINQNPTNAAVKTYFDMLIVEKRMEDTLDEYRFKKVLKISATPDI